jgi:hypothetical protein
MAFSDNVWWTRKARIQTEKRLLSNAFQSQILLLWYSFSGVAVSIYYLKFGPSNPSIDLSGVSWLIFSILVLCISGFINGLSLKERAALIKKCYETLNGIYHQAKSENADIEELTLEYEQILSMCENHTDDDDYRALCITYATHHDPKGEVNIADKLSRLPTWYHWLTIAWSTIKRFTMLSSFYLLPIIVLIVLGKLV